MAKKSVKKAAPKTSTRATDLAKQAGDAAEHAHYDADLATEAAREIGWIAKRGEGFMNFIREQGVIGLAVGLAIGAAAGDTVKKLVDALINPIVQLLIGSQQGLEQAHTVVQLGGRVGDFKWGAFVSSLITLLAVAFVIYFIVKGLKLDKLDKKKDA